MSVIHFCIDMQRVQTAKLNRSAQKILQRGVNALVSSLEDRDVPTVLIAYGGPYNFEPYAQGIGHLHDMPRRTKQLMMTVSDLRFDVPVVPMSLVGIKSECSVYAEEGIRDYVKKHGYSSIILSGLFESTYTVRGSCVTETARDFAAAGYEVTIAAEATNRAYGVDRSIPFLEDRRAFHEDLGAKVETTATILDDIDSNPYAVATVSRDRRLRAPPRNGAFTL